MPETFAVHEPLLVNILGHAAGALVFGVFLFLLLRDRAGSRRRGSRLTIASAALAVTWNGASLVASVLFPPNAATEAVTGLAFAALSLLPAVLLHLSLGPALPAVRWSGYGLSIIATALHSAELVLAAPTWHRGALQLTTVGFGVLTALAVLAGLRRSEEGRSPSVRVVGPMVLFLFALSMLHLGEEVSLAQAWHMELLVHHAGIPLALAILLQDFRFLLLDAFVRVMANLLLAAAFVSGAAWTWRWAALRGTESLVLGWVAACLLLLLFSFSRARLQHALTRLVFRHADVARAIDYLHHEAASAADEAAFLHAAVHRLGAFVRAESAEFAPDLTGLAMLMPTPVADLASDWRDRLQQRGAEIAVPLRLAPGDDGTALLGRRAGGRRYLSEDLQALAVLAGHVARLVERFRDSERRRLISQAELRALQAQINPHFLFNALNALYGTIPREAAGARRTVLNLADIFRFFLQTDRTYLPLDEELRIVAAYLEVESLRLGPKLRTEIDLDDATRSLPIPALTVQPLVENAVKHGVSRRTAGGVVRVEAHVKDDRLLITVSDTGPGFAAQTSSSDGTGVGLENVRRRLQLCYGTAAALDVESGPHGTRVRLAVPARATVETTPQEVRR